MNSFNKMVSPVVIILLFVFIFLSTQNQSFSQTKKEFDDADKLTYEFYLKQNWDKVIEAGNDAIKNNIDFYLLRMRIGIAYYSKDNYMSAVEHFEKALEFVKKDTVAMEYLYYSYLFSGRESDANLFAETFSFNLKSKIKYKNPEFFSGAYTEGGYTFNSGYDDLKNTNIFGLPGTFGTQKILKGYRYNNISLIHRIGNRVRIFQGYNNIGINYTQQFNPHFNLFLDSLKEFDVNTNQNEYYINANVNLGEGFNLLGAFHFQNVKFQNMNVVLDTTVFPPRPNYLMAENTLNESVIFISLSKYFSHFVFTMNTSYSNLNNGKQMQNGFTGVYYPLGNLNLYFISDFNYISSKDIGIENFENNWVVTGKGGFKLSEPVWLEGSFTYGDIKNYNESNAFIVYNNTEVIKRRFEFDIIWLINKNFEFSARYQNFLVEHKYYTYTNPFNYTTSTNNFLNQTIIGGLKWTF